jgi:hypothetical protein
MISEKPNYTYTIKLIVAVMLAVGANFLLNTLIENLRLPLFLDTLFTCAVTFAAGPIPGIASALLTTFIIGFRYEVIGTYLFVLCSIAEVLLIWSFHRFYAPARRSVGGSSPGSSGFINKAAGLILLYFTACAVISILGGIIDFVLYMVMSRPKFAFSPEDTFKLGLLRGNMPMLAANILSRIPINVVDRFITIIGGYGLSVGIGKVLGRKATARATKSDS